MISEQAVVTRIHCLSQQVIKVVQNSNCAARSVLKEPSQTASCSTTRLGNIDVDIKHKLFFTVLPHSLKIKDNWTNVKAVDQSYKWISSQIVHRRVVIWTCLSEKALRAPS